MKHSLPLILFLLLAAPVKADDFTTIYDRLYAKALTLPTASEVQNVLSILKTDGSFSDLNYADVAFAADLSVHLKRLQTLGAAYSNPSSTEYKNTSIKDKYFICLDFWITKNQTPGNWWYRHIAYPKAASPAIILLGELMKTEKPDLFNRAMDYLLWAYLQNNYMEGANGADKIVGAYTATVLKRDDAQLSKMRMQIIGLIQIQSKGEGIEADVMFGQHSGNGRQLYGATYGGEYIKSILAYLTTVNATAYTVTSKEISLLETLYLSGIQWIIYAKHMDPSQTGRQNSSTAGVGSWTNMLSDFVLLNPPRKAELQTALERMQNGLSSKNPLLLGNKMYWRFDYMLQRGSNFFATTRMTSTRTVGAEAGNGQGNNNYYGGAGVNYIFRTGNEYNSIFTELNYRQFPGITAEQDAAALPIPNWGAGGTNNNVFAGGVSYGKEGACGMLLDKRGITAAKSWFYFDDEFVALGAGITQTNGTATVYTTMNQCIKYTNVDYVDDQTQKSLSTGTATLSKPKWVVQDQVGYFNLDNTSAFVVSAETRNGINIFTSAIDHGKNPANKDYAYVVKPGITASEAISYSANIPVQILQNTSALQAVKHKTLPITQLIFYKAGSLIIPGEYTVTATIPCALMIKQTGDNLEISLANPKCESSNPASMSISITKKLTGPGSTWDGTKSTLVFNLPQGNYAGQTVTQTYHIDLISSVNNVDNQGAKLLIYPNPVQSHLSMDWLTAEVPAFKISIYNVTGALVFFKEVRAYSQHEEIDLTDQPNGIYYLNVATAAGTQIRKVAVIH
jgi:chondroitin AC lyase